MEIWSAIRWDRVPKWMDMVKKVVYTSEEREKVGATAHWVGEAGGIKSEWDSEMTEWEPNERVSWRSTAGSFTGIGSMTLAPTSTGTVATLMMDYELPYSILGKKVDKLHVCKAVEGGTERALRELKAIVEKKARHRSTAKPSFSTAILEL